MAQDWADLNRYKKHNNVLGKPLPNENRIVFMGNSIIESWESFLPEFFSNKNYINRGISGQTTPQMLIRFRPDVIDIEPKAVMILAGINDIAENTGPATVKMITDNIISMAELAKINDIKVVVCSILPANGFPWNPSIDPDQKINAINTAMKDYAKKNEMVYLDYYSSMVDDKNELKEDYTYDGVHPNKTGYRVMSDLANKAISTIFGLNGIND